jgi:hypothetical protein
MRRLLACLGACGGLLATAAPALAHECFNPNKPAGAGVNYTVVDFTSEGPVLEQTGPGKGIGGFASLSTELTGGEKLPDVHTLGHSAAKDDVGGPGSMKPEHACDGKGIDYLFTCFGG